MLTFPVFPRVFQFARGFRWKIQIKPNCSLVVSITTSRIIWEIVWINWRSSLQGNISFLENEAESFENHSEIHLKLNFGHSAAKFKMPRTRIQIVCVVYSNKQYKVLFSSSSWIFLRTRVYKQQRRSYRKKLHFRDWNNLCMIIPSFRIVKLMIRQIPFIERVYCIWVLVYKSAAFILRNCALHRRKIASLSTFKMYGMWY